jgi:hypothetical protein
MVDRVTSELAALRPDLFQNGGPHLVRHDRRHRSDIYVYSAKPDDGVETARLWVKIARKTDESDRHYMFSPEKEFESIENIYSGVSSLDRESRHLLIVPKPICYLPESSAIVTEKVDGTHLVPALVRGNVAHCLHLGIDRQQELAYRTGKVLRMLHDLMDTGRTAPLNPDERLRWVAEYRSEGLLDDPLMSKVEESMSAYLEEVGTTEYRVSRKHGDFQPTNIMIVRDLRIAVFDFWFARPDVVLSDVCSFLMGLRSLCLRYPLPRRAAYHYRLEKEFLEGYFQNDPVPGTALRCVGLSWLLHQYDHAVKRRPGGVGRKWIDHCFKGMFRQLMDRDGAAGG